MDDQPHVPAAPPVPGLHHALVHEDGVGAALDHLGDGIAHVLQPGDGTDRGAVVHGHDDRAPGIAVEDSLHSDLLADHARCLLASPGASTLPVLGVHMQHPRRRARRRARGEQQACSMSIRPPVRHRRRGGGNVSGLCDRASTMPQVEPRRQHPARHTGNSRDSSGPTAPPLPSPSADAASFSPWIGGHSGAAVETAG